MKYLAKISLILVLASTQLFGQENLTFGEKISKGKIIPANEVASKVGNKQELDLRVSGEIKEVCQMKGCWMTMDLGNGESMRITFKDYAFFVPKDSDGSQAIVEGVAKKEEQSVATLRHYAEDAGKSEEEIAEITEPQQTLVFEAAGVLIKSE